MLALIAVLTLAQLTPPPLVSTESPPPLVPVESRPPLVSAESPPPLVAVDPYPAEALIAPPTPPPAGPFTAPPAVKVEDPARSYAALQVSFMKELDLHRQLSAVSLQIAEMDVSGPGWAAAARGLGYFLVVPTFLFLVPVVSGASLAVGAANAMSTTQTLTPTFNTVGIVLAVVTTILLVAGISGGVIGWLLKRQELDGLIQQRTSLEAQLEAAARTRPRSF